MSDYPSEAQIKECLDAYKKGGTALEELLAKRNQEAMAAPLKPAAPTSKDQEDQGR